MTICDVLLQDCFLTMSPAWYQSLIKVLLNRFPQSCRHFDDNGIQYLVSRGFFWFYWFVFIESLYECQPQLFSGFSMT